MHYISYTPDTNKITLRVNFQSFMFFGVFFLFLFLFFFKTIFNFFFWIYLQKILNFFVKLKKIRNFRRNTEKWHLWRYPEQFFPLAAQFWAPGRKLLGGLLQPPLGELGLRSRILERECQAILEHICVPLYCKLSQSDKDSSIPYKYPWIGWYWYNVNIPIVSNTETFQYLELTVYFFCNF